MEIVVGVETSEEGKIEDNSADKSCSDSAYLKRIANPVVYKLVRVDFDGKLVPATDDEFMEVENLLKLEEKNPVSISGSVEAVGQGLDKDNTSDQHLPKKFKGSSEKNAAEVIDKSPNELEEMLAPSVSNLNKRDAKQCESTDNESSLQGDSGKRGYIASNPDFSFLKGEINLDKLTMRELQETFRATFGRKTTVKDKPWLKRRISMGLTNSCDVSVTKFIIKDGKFLKKEDVENGDCEGSVAGEVLSAGNDVAVDCQNVIEDDSDGSDLRNSVSESGHGSDVSEKRGVKRHRKPTKRYIEESTDKDTGHDSGNLMPTTKCLVHNNKVIERTNLGAVTRPDSFGGFSIQVPFVSRVRRARPRKSIISLTKFQTSIGALVRKFAEHSVTMSDPQSRNLRGNKVIKDKYVQFKELIATEKAKEKHPRSGTMNVSPDSGSNDATDSRDYLSQENAMGFKSDGNRGSASKIKDGSRKQQRAWSITEVVKLVDGVSRFGIGRWSAIKKLSFSSSPHRSAVDLKDKWRNLLKACYAKPVNPRKSGQAQTPVPIMMKVRELAEIHGQAPRMIIKGKRATRASEESVNDKSRLGYL